VESNSQHEALDHAANLDQAFEVDAGVEPHRLQHEGGVLHHDVAGRTRSPRAAAEAAEGGVEAAHADLQGRENIRETEPARVVEMRADRHPAGHVEYLAEDPADCGRIAVADRVGEHQRIGLVRVQSARPMRTRPRFPEWSAVIQATFLTTVLNRSEVIDFMKIAGAMKGLGDWRPKYGSFAVQLD
jgi:hypothetical protein